MAICLNNNYLIIGHQTIISINIHSQEISEINLDYLTIIEEDKVPKHPTKKEDTFIQSIGYDYSSRQYLITTDAKHIFILNEKFTTVRSFLTKRAISSAAFDNENNILIADKTGDVYIYKTQGEPECLLGHLSMLLDIKISLKGKFVVTSDRDEKIRVSKYPNAYNIQCYCLGHSEYVRNIELWKDLIVSGSGDGTIRVWNIESGKQKAIVNTNDYIDDKELIDNFKKTMAEDDTFVNCLPITNLQIFEFSEDKLFIVVSIHMLRKLQIYCLDYVNNDVKLIYKESVEYSGDLVDFYLSLKHLHILTNESLYLYIFENDNFIRKQSNYVDKFVTMYQTFFNKLKHKDVTVLYKKTFDNVQDYLERKKMRIELKNQ